METILGALSAGYICGILFAFFSEGGSILQKAVPILFLLGVSWVAGVSFSARNSETSSNEDCFPDGTFKRITPVIIVIFVLGMAVAYTQTHKHLSFQHENTLARVLRSSNAGSTISVKGALLGPIEEAGRGMITCRIRVDETDIPDYALACPTDARCRINTWKRGNNSKLLRWLRDGTAEGLRVRVKGRVVPVREPGNPNAFDFLAYLKENFLAGVIDADLQDITILDADTTGRSTIGFIPYLRRRILRTFNKALDPKTAALASGMTLGLRSAMRDIEVGEYDALEAFQRAGLSHALAVSGLHVSLIAGTLCSLFSWMRCSRTLSVPLTICLMALFVLVTGAKPPSVRAGIMSGIALLAYAFCPRQTKSAVYIGLFTAALAILMMNPFLLFSPGFQLSFGAVLSLMLLTPLFEDLLVMLAGARFIVAIGAAIGLFGLVSYASPFLYKYPVVGWIYALCVWMLLNVSPRLDVKWPRLRLLRYAAWPLWFRRLFAAQLAIQVGCLIPLSAWYFGQYSIAGSLVNLLGIPLMSLFVPSAMAVAVAGFVPWGGEILLWPLGRITDIFGSVFLFLARFGAEWFSYPPIPKPSLSTLCAYYLAICGCIRLHRQLRRPNSKHVQSAPSFMAHKEWKRGVTIALLIAAFATAIADIPDRLEEIYIVDVSAASRGVSVPSLVFMQTRRRAIILNPGDEYVGSRILFRLLCARNNLRVTHALSATAVPRFGLDGGDVLKAMAFVDCCLAPEGARPGWESLAKVTRGLLRDAEITFIPCAGRGKAVAHSMGNTLCATDETCEMPANPSAIKSYLTRIRWRETTILVVSDVSITESDWAELCKCDLAADMLVLPCGETGSAAERKKREEWIRRMVSVSNPSTIVFAGQACEWMLAAASQATKTKARIISTHDSGAIRIFAGDSAEKYSQLPMLKKSTLSIETFKK